MTIHEAVRYGREVLTRAGVPSPEVDAWWLLEAATGATRAALIVEGSRPLDPAAEASFRAMLERRAAREPLQHIVGETEFYGLGLKVDARALIPRPETERLVELALERLRGVERPAVVDVGTGSGAIALAVKSERPDTVVLATDVSRDALALARENAAGLGLGVEFIRSDLLTAPDVRAFAGRAHAIVTNPPYLPERDRTGASPEVARDPVRALYAGPDGLDVAARLIDQASSLLAPGAWLLAELDPRNVAAAANRAETWSEIEIAADLSGRERFLVLRR